MVDMGNNDLFQTQVESGRQNINSPNPTEQQPVSEIPDNVSQAVGNVGQQGEFKAPEGASVSQRLLDLLDKNNPYITRAETKAQQNAVASGLQNSTMAKTAGQTAAIESAAPIAQADAELFTSLYSNDQTAKNQANLYTLQGEISKNLSEQQGNIDLSKIRAQSNAEASNIELQGQIDLANQEAQNVWENKFLQDKIALEQSQLSSDNQRIAMENFNSIQQDFQKDWMEILLNPNFATDEDRQKALDDLVASTQSRIDTLSTLYGIPLVWDSPEDAVAPEEPVDTTNAPTTPGYSYNPNTGMYETSVNPQTNPNTYNA